MVRRRVWGMVAALFAVPAVAAASGYGVSVGAEYTRGDYGTGSNITLLSLPLKLDYAEERYAWSLSLPWLWVSGPGDVVVSGSGMGRFSTTKTSSTTRTDSGLGDIRVSGTVRLWAETAQRPWAALTAKAKFATADAARRLGTGANDYALQLELAKDALYGHAGYLVLGDPAGVDYRNIGYGAIGFNFPIGGAAGGVELYGEQAPLDGIDGKRELTLYLGGELDRKTRIVGHVLKGLSDASPDWGVGVTVRFAL